MSLTGDEKRQYQLNWMKERRLAWIKENGPCQKCGSSEDLEVDHVDRSTKKYHISRLWSRRADVRNAELAKCQVLCGVCHSAKTLEEFVTRDHGSTMYDHGCRCMVCKEDKRDKQRVRRNTAANRG